MWCAFASRHFVTQFTANKFDDLTDDYVHLTDYYDNLTDDYVHKQDNGFEGADNVALFFRP